MKKVVLLLGILFSSSVFADSIKLEDLPKVPLKLKYLPISDGYELNSLGKVQKGKDESKDFSLRQENRFSGPGMKRSFYTGTLFHYKVKKWNIPLFNGWYIENIKTNGCFKPAIISMIKTMSTRKEQFGFNVWYDSKQCIIQDRVPQVYNIVYLNGKYVVVTTNINSFVFDVERGKFLQDYLQTDGKVLQYFITEDKQIAVKASKDWDYDGTLRYFKNNGESLYKDLSESDQIFLERLMEFFGNPMNLEKPEKWKMDDFQKMLFNK